MPYVLSDEVQHKIKICTMKVGNVMKKPYIFILIAIVTGIFIILYTTRKKSQDKLQERLESTSAQELLKTIDSIKQKNIIFDFTGVLFYLNVKKIAYQIGLHKLFLYTITHFKNPLRLKKILFDFLDSISEFEPHDKAQFRNINLPDLVCQWLSGYVSGQHVRSIIKQALNKQYKNGYFASSLEKELIFLASETIFNPDVVINIMEPLQDTFRLIKALHAKHDENGRRKHHIYGLSNMDFATIAKLKNRYHDIFDHFDGIVVSADTGNLKPDQEIYQYFLRTYKLKPEACLFIDDQTENIKAAQNLGFKVVKFIRT